MTQSANPKSPVARASEILLDGKLKKFPGITGSNSLSLDAFPFIIPSGTIDLVTACASVGPFVVPFAATIMAVWLGVTGQCGTGAALIVAGTTADNDHFIDDYSVGTSVVVGSYDISADATVVITAITAGDVIVFGSDGGATSTGAAGLNLFCCMA